MRDTVISIRNLAVVRKDKTRTFKLFVPKFDVRRGCCVSLYGVSGSGKSTLLELLACTLSPDLAEPDEDSRFEISPSQEITFRIDEMWREGQQDRLAGLRRRFFGYIPQSAGLLPYLTVAQNISLPADILGNRDKGFLEEVTARLGLSSHLSSLPKTLSGGERHRVAIARAFANRPSVIFADEPTASLDPMNAAEVMDLLCDAATKFGASLVMSCHDESLLEARNIAICTPEFEPDEGGTIARFTFSDESLGA